ncbi:MAG: hypothetical protein PVF58_21825 [Candidatus Methanofastidiosia archaeon]|jgi:hypothetical protein
MKRKKRKQLFDPINTLILFTLLLSFKIENTRGKLKIKRMRKKKIKKQENKKKRHLNRNIYIGKTHRIIEVRK